MAKDSLRIGGAAVLLALAALASACGGQSGSGQSSGPAAGSAASRLPLPLPPSRGRAYYVSPGGRDSNPGTLAQPWQTIQKAADTLRPGERAFVRRGVYRENVQLRRSGTAAKPITIAAYGRERPVISHASGPLEIDAGYHRVRGFVLERAKGTSSTNVYFQSDAHHIELSRNEIRYSQDQGVFSEEETHHLHVLGNRIHDNGLGHASGQHQSHGIYLQGRLHVAANNLVFNHPYGFGIQVYDQNSRSILVNNTITGAAHSGIVVGGEGGVDNITIRNNILAFNAKYGVQTDSDCPTGPILIDANVIFGNRDGPVQRGCSQLRVGSNILADPRFASRVRRDFRLGPGSPAVDRARGDFAPRTDILGRKRPRGRGYDVGAFERAG
ncbi:MAG: right-handed parallel beta-helix repeat-containing protein [Gaiellaceae bacterium]